MVYTLTFLQQEPSVHFDTLSPEAFESCVVLVASGSMQEQIQKQGVSRVSLQDAGSLRHGYLVGYGEENLSLFLEADACAGSNRPAIEMAREPEAWAVDLQVGQKEMAANWRGFMKPPRSSPSKNQQSPVNETNPADFLRSRYYNILYQLKMPLSYFPKTTLPRLRNMCETAEANTLTLLSMYLPVDQFASAQERFRAMVSSKEHVSVSGEENQNQQNFISSHLSNASDESIANMVLSLKIREAQLQIVLLLELIVVQQIDESHFSTEQPLLPEKKRSLVRKKGKKLMPTLTGLAVQASLEDSEKLNQTSLHDQKTLKKSHSDAVSLRRSLFSLVDQIGLWDSLLGRKVGSDENTHGFLAHVIVPYFNKSLPLLVPMIIRAFKSLRPHLKPVKKRSAAPTPEDSSQAPKKSKFSKQLLSADQISSLHRASSSDLHELKPAFSLKRSKSNLGGSKDLQRRQVDMSVAKNEVDDPKSSFIFADARKTKSVMDERSHFGSASKSNTMEVGATPAKPKSNTQVMATPSTAQVMATPSNTRTVDLHACVQETPVAATSLHEKLAQARNELAAIESSPVGPVSPVQKRLRVRPGSKVSLQDSPFFKYREESPFSGPHSTDPTSASPSSVKEPGKRKPRLVRSKNAHTEAITGLENGHEQEQNNVEPRAENKEPSSLSSTKIEFSLTRQDTVRVESPNLATKPSSSVVANDFHGGSDSDSDYERLLAASKPTLKKYTKRR